jgi:hypothetical protein
MVIIFTVVIGNKMTQSERELMYRILFEDSDEEPTPAIYEIYDTISELVSDIDNMEVTQVTLH